MFSKSISRCKRSSTFCPQRFVDTAELCTMEIHRMLWTCIDLKAHVNNFRSLGEPLKNKKVTMLCSCQNNCTNLIVQSALKTLGADLRMMSANKWETSSFKRDVGRFYSLFSDMIMVQGESHQSVCELSAGADVPVVNMCSQKFAPLHGLAVLMTIQEHFGRLNGLTLGWVGPMGRHLNTLIYLLPKVGINLRYNDSPKPDFPRSPLVLPAGMTFCDTYKTKIEHFSDPQETIKEADVVATSKHKEETMQIELEMLNKANEKWAFLHLLPRWKDDVSEELFNHKNCLVWNLQENIQYTTMAVALNLLQPYIPVITKPNFETRYN